MIAFNLLLFYCVILQVDCNLDVDMIVKFCQSRHLYYLTVFSCSSKSERVNLLKQITTNGISTTIIDMNNSQVDKFHRNSNVGFVADADCYHFPSFISKIDEKYFFENYLWLITTEKQLELVENVLNNVALNINSNVHLGILQFNNWLIYDIYNQAHRHNGELKIVKLGIYNFDKGYQANYKMSKYWNRRNMSGVHFKTAIVVPNPNIQLDWYLYSEEHRQENSMHRFQFTTIRYCRDFFNFSLSIDRTNSWGYRQQNGQFDGLVGLLDRRLVDFGSSPLLLKLDRLPSVDYSYGNWILRSTFIYRRPKIEADAYEIFLRPLSNIVWICIFCIIISVILLLKIVVGQEKQLFDGLLMEVIDNSWSHLVVLILGVFSQQGAYYNLRLLSSRILLIFTLLFSILIYQFYSASIVSYLLMDPPRTINNLKDLTDSDLKVGIEDILIDRNYFKQTTDPIALKLFNRKIKNSTDNSGFYPPNEGLNLIKKGGFAYHVETSTAYPIIAETFTNQEVCELEEIQLYPTQPMYTNLQKHSPFREMMNYCMLEIVNKGLMYRLRNYWDTKKPLCIKTAKADDIVVDLQEFSCALKILTYGSCLSLFFLICEILYVRHFHELKRLSIVQPFIH